MKKIKKRSKFPKCPKSFPGVQTCLGALFWKNFFAQCSMDSSKVFEKIKKIQNCKNAQDRTENCANFFWTCFVAIFQKKRMPRVPWRVGPSKKLKKNQKILKIPKKRKTFPKVCKHVLNMFWGNFFPQTFAQCSMEGRVFKKFQKSKKAQNHSLKCSTVFWTCFGAIFLKTFFAPCSMEGRAFESFQKNQKNSKIQKSPKSFPKVSTRVLNMLWAMFLKIFCPVFHAVHFRFSGLKYRSSVFRNNTQQTVFLHSRHSQYTQSHFRFSGLKTMSSDSPN